MDSEAATAQQGGVDQDAGRQAGVFTACARFAGLTRDTTSNFDLFSANSTGTTAREIGLLQLKLGRLCAKFTPTIVVANLLCLMDADLLW